MYYGDQQAYYTNLRASFGAYGGAVASGAYAGGGMPVGGMPSAPTDPVGGLAYMGAQVQPVSYMPPARIFAPGTGMYIQETSGFFPSVGRAMGYHETPRNVMTADYRMNAAADVGERLGLGVASAAVAGAGTLAAGAVGAPIGAAVGGVVGAGVGGLLAAPFGAAPVGGLAGAFVGKAIGGLVGGMGAMQFAGDVTDLIVQQRQLRNYLETSTFRSVTASSPMADMRRGQGMGVGARQAITEMITEMDINDPMMNMEDLTRTLQGAVGMGLMNNTQTVDDFKRKFKDITENLKLVVRTMNTTLEEGLKTMQEFRGIGITDVGTVGDMVVQSSIAGRVAGRTAQEMVTIGMQGADMFRGTGVSMGIGFQQNINNVAAIRAARDAGTLSQEAVAQAGGVEALAQRMTASGLSFAQTGLGRGVGAAFFTPGDLLNPEQMGRFLTGQGPGFVGLAQRAAGNLRTPGRMMEYQARQPQFLSKIGEMLGGQGLQVYEMQTAMAMADFYRQQAPEMDQETAFRYSLQQMGKSEPEIEAMLGTVRNAEGAFGARQRSAEVERDRTMIEQSYQNFFLTRFKERFISDPYLQVKDLIARPVNRAIDTTVERTKTFFEEEFLGVERATLRGIDLESGRGQAAARLMMEGDRAGAVRAERLRTGEVNLDEAGFFAPSAGETVLKEMRRGSLARSLGITEEDVGGGTFNGVILNTRPLGFGGREGITFEQARRLQEETRVFRMTGEEARAREKEGGDAYREAVRRVKSGATRFDIENMDFSRAVLKLTGKESIKDVTEDDYAALMNTLGGRKAFARKAEEARVEANAYQMLDNAINTKSMQNLQKSFEDVKEDVERRFSRELGGDALPAGVLERVAEAADSNLTAEQREEKLTDASLLLSDGTGMTAVQARAMIGELAGATETQEAMGRVGSLLRGDQEALSRIARGTQDLSSMTDLGYGRGVRSKADPSAKIENLIRKRAAAAGVEVSDLDVRRAAGGFLRAYRKDPKASLEKAISGYSPLSFSAQEAKGLMEDIRTYQSMSGARERKAQLLQHTETMKGPEKTLLVNAAEMLSTPEGILGLSEEQIGLLSKSGFGDIAAPARLIRDVRAQVSALQKDPNSAQAKQALRDNLVEFSKLQKLGWSDKTIDESMGVLTKGGGLMQMSQITMQSLSPKSMTSGGAGGTSATQTGTAIEAYNVQTRINRSILDAFLSLQSRLPSPQQGR